MTVIVQISNMRTIVIILTMMTVYWSFIDAFDIGKLSSSLGNLGQLQNEHTTSYWMIKDNLGKSGNNLFKLRRRRSKDNTPIWECSHIIHPSQTLIHVDE
ncbi:hypothetical protein EWB00_009655 [Schistosoma japonicum]|uniref:Uncharacterized protein n=1 Tax=Schistosoma japonicum TaxID=6182 RepID=A0A4Z2CLN2_SCHJA|nr:hypothetical protein EWB00_009655 [Schistosoma japonicum]